MFMFLLSSPIASYTPVRRMVCEPNACMCGRDSEPALRRLQTIRGRFFAQTQRELDAPGVDSRKIN